MDCDLCLKNLFSMDKTKRFEEGKSPSQYEKNFLTEQADNGVCFPGFEGPRSEAYNHLLEGGRKVHWMEDGTL